MTTETTLDTTSIVHEIWGESANGAHAQIEFLSRPESYDTRDQAQQLADRYNREQENFNKPMDTRIRCYVRSFTIRVIKKEID